MTFAASDERPRNKWPGYIAGTAATALLSAMATELGRWAIEELKTRMNARDDATDCHDE